MDDLTEIGAGGLAFDSDVLPAERRFAVWASAMPFYEVATSDPPAFRASVRAWLLAPVIVVDATLSEIALRRTAARLGRDGNDDIVLQLLDGATMTGSADAPFAAGPTSNSGSGCRTVGHVGLEVAASSGERSGPTARVFSNSTG